MQNSSVVAFKAHGYAGLLVIVTAEVLLFVGNRLVGEWFTPIVWTGFVLFVDALVFRTERRSPLVTDRLELLVVAVISIACWWLFEFYNAPRFWSSDLELWWHYQNLEPNPYLRRAAYDWAFATIFPAMFLTAELLAATLFRSLNGRKKIRISPPLSYLLIVAGGLAAVIPLVFISPWLVPLVWLSFALLLDPLNALRGWPSLTGDLARGDFRRLAALIASGSVCGLLWEFWNYWATTKWTYTVPYFGNIKLFEMPVLGYLGFPPFAVGCWAMYVFGRSLLTPGSHVDERHWQGLWPTASE